MATVNAPVSTLGPYVARAPIARAPVGYGAYGMARPAYGAYGMARPAYGMGYGAYGGYGGYGAYGGYGMGAYGRSRGGLFGGSSLLPLLLLDDDEGACTATAYAANQCFLKSGSNGIFGGDNDALALLALGGGGFGGFGGYGGFGGLDPLSLLLLTDDDDLPCPAGLTAAQASAQCETRDRGLFRSGLRSNTDNDDDDLLTILLLGGGLGGGFGGLGGGLFGF